MKAARSFETSARRFTKPQIYLLAEKSLLYLFLLHCYVFM